MNEVELLVLNSDQAGMSVIVRKGTYRIIRRSAENFDIRSTLASSNVEQWQLNQEDMEMASAQLSSHVDQESALVSMDDFDRADDLPVWDQRMSQPHAMVLVDGERAMVVDMGSRNGTFVNGERVGASDLNDGDLMRCGATRIHIHAR